MNRYCVPTLVAIVLAATLTSNAQVGQGDEAAIIRQHLKVPDATNVYLARWPRLPRGPLHVFIDVGFAADYRDYLQGQVSVWNRDTRGASEYIVLERDISAANVIFLRYDLPNQARAETRSSVETVVITDPATGQQRQEAVPRVNAVTVIPSYGYILTREPDGIAIQARYLAVEPAGQDFRYEQLWAEFVRLTGKPPKSKRRFFP